MYDPFEPGRIPVRATTIQLTDAARGRDFPCEIWYPAEPGTYPLAVYSHPNGGHRRSATFLCEHLSSHGYVVAAMDHWETVTEPPPIDTDTQLTAWIDTMIANRVPDIRLLLDQVLDGPLTATVDPARIGIVGHSFGGWTALAAPDVEPRIGAVVALAPAGSARPLPGVLPATLDFRWGRTVPVLYLAAGRDTVTPLDGIIELYRRTPMPRQLAVLRRADHLHFQDDVEQAHEAARAMSLPGASAWIPKAMPPIGELCSGAQAHLFTRGLTLAHFDAALRESAAAQRFLAGDLKNQLAVRGADATV
jgi:predicted dienelactone hydrolase